MILTATGDRRPATEILPIAALVVVALLVFAKPFTTQEVLTLRDHADYFQPLRFFTAHELRHGQLPLWNPYNASGEPWLANPQTGVFYPPTWLFLVLPFATAYILFLAAHVALLGCSTFVLLRRFAARDGAFLAALTVMLCGPTLSLLDVQNTLTTLAWIPLVIWCAVSVASPAWSAVVIAMSFLAGEPFFAACAALVFVLLRRRRDIVDIALTAFALVSVQLLPFLAALRGSDRLGSVDPSEILRDSMRPLDWLRLAVPPSLGSAASSQQFVPVVYFGAVGCLLAIVGIVAGRKRRVAQVAAIFVVIAIVVAAGSYFRPVAFALTRFPVTLFRYPARMVPLAALALAALIAVGWDEIASAVRYRWLPVALAALILADLTPAIAPLLKSAPFDAHPTPYAASIGRDAKLVRLTSARVPDRRAWISGYMNLFDRRFDAWTAAPMVRETYVRAYQHALASRAAFDAMANGYILSDRPLSRFPQLSRARTVWLYRNPSALPLAYWRGGDGRIVAPGLLVVGSSVVHMAIDAPADGLVIVTQQSDAGWRVTVDGAAAPAEAEGVFRAVRVKRGHHVIVWGYHPFSFFAGFFLSALGVLRLLFSFLFVKRARRKNFFDEQLQARGADVESRSSNNSI